MWPQRVNSKTLVLVQNQSLQSSTNPNLNAKKEERKNPLEEPEMHELLLFGSVPSARHPQLLNVLSGLTLMQPSPLRSERHLVFKPNRSPNTVASSLKVGGAQDVGVVKSHQQMQAAALLGDLFYVQLVAEVS